MNIPTRPDLTRTDFEITRVWNTFLRADHQLNAEQHLRRPLAARDVAAAAADSGSRTTRRRAHEAETDVDWTVVGNLSSVIGSTKVNTFRVSAVSEDVFFGNPNFNTNGHDQKILLPQLNYPELPGSAERARQPPPRRGLRRRQRRSPGSCPNKGGRSRPQVRHQLPVFVAAERGLRQHERRRSRSTAICRSTATTRAPIPERLSIRVPSAVGLPDEGALHRHVRAGQVEAEQQPDPQPRRALRPRDPADAQPGQPAVRQTIPTAIRWTSTTSRRASGSRGRPTRTGGRRSAAASASSTSGRRTRS